jgi:hypothetical protein
VKEPGVGPRRRNLDDHPVFYSIELLAVFAYIAGVAFVSGHFDFPSQQLVLAAGLALGLLVLKFVRSVQR